MVVINANELTDDFELEVDLCVVGAGAAGISIVDEFDSCSLKVLLIESGSFSFNKETQALYEFENIGLPVSQESRTRSFGGTTNVWDGKCVLLNDIDFEQREWVPNSGWPISYSELFPYYQRALKVLKLPSFKYFDPIFWKQKLADKPREFLPEKFIFDSEELKPEVCLRARTPLRFGYAYLEKLRKSPNIDICINANVTEIEVCNNLSNVERLHMSCLKGTTFFVKAKVFVLACGGLENARLLLLSRNSNPAGLGNEFDIVGRYYMEHPKGKLAVMMPYNKISTSSLLLNSSLFFGNHIPKGKINLGIRLSKEVQKRERVLNHYVLFEPYFSKKLHTAYQSLRLLGKLLSQREFENNLSKHFLNFVQNSDALLDFLTKKILNQPVACEFLTVINHLEQQPNSESRVTLGNERDRLGSNLLKVEWKISSEEKRSLRRFYEILEKYLEIYKIGRLKTVLPEENDSPWTELKDSSHHMGTTRMSDNPRRGVVNKDCQVHSVSNLFIAGSSVFPTGGHANPTFTIVALAIRLADHLKERFRIIS